MKGYYTKDGYMGYIPSKKKFMLFATEEEYEEYFVENEKE